MFTLKRGLRSRREAGMLAALRSQPFLALAGERLKEGTR